MRGQLSGMIGLFTTINHFDKSQTRRTHRMPSDYEIVYTAHGQLDAEMIKVLLESNGVQASVAGESVGKSYGIILGPLGDMDILVPVDQADTARSILDAMERGDLDLGSEEKTR
jgi:hypothetical protein